MDVPYGLREDRVAVSYRRRHEENDSSRSARVVFPGVREHHSVESQSALAGKSTACACLRTEQPARPFASWLESWLCMQPRSGERLPISYS